MHVFAEVYAAPAEHWGVYETCEELVDLEDNLQLWRFRHLKVVERTIGHKRGTGGSSGVDFLRRALDLTFFPELYAVRSEIGDRAAGLPSDAGVKGVRNRDRLYPHARRAAAGRDRGAFAGSSG